MSMEYEFILLQDEEDEWDSEFDEDDE